MESSKIFNYIKNQNFLASKKFPNSNKNILRIFINFGYYVCIFPLKISQTFPNTNNFNLTTHNVKTNKGQQVGIKKNHIAIHILILFIILVTMRIGPYSHHYSIHIGS